MDHVPSKSLLQSPYPENLPTFAICHGCNNELSRNEEYLSVFLTCVLEGTCDPNRLTDDKVARALRRNPRLLHELQDARREHASPGGQATIYWQPDFNKLIPPLLKNASGHYAFELGEPPEAEPLSTIAIPLPLMSAAQLAHFESVSFGQMWPEVGSRMMSRIASSTEGWGPDMQEGWIVVQPQVYRYAIHELRTVRMILREYLAFEAVWE